MKVTVPNRSLRRILRWSKFGLFTCAAAMLGYCAYVVIDARLFQARESREFERMLELQAKLVRPPDIPRDSMNGLIGRMEIERLGLSVMVAEGYHGETLRRGAGHVPGTALPGEPGNIGITGHRDTFFRPLHNIQIGDVIALTTLWGEFHYRVVATDIVNPEDIEVLDPTSSQTLTLVTCYPFYFVGAAPNRFIVRAERVRGSPSL